MTGRYKRRKGGSGEGPKGQRVACSHTRTGGCDADASHLLRANQGHVNRSQQQKLNWVAGRRAISRDATMLQMRS